MIRREADRYRILTQVMKTYRLRFADQMPQHPVASGEVTDEAGTIFIDAHRNEMTELGVITDDPQGPVPCTDQLAR